MSKPTNNPTPVDGPTANALGNGLRFARIVIALGLLVGIVVFTVITIETLRTGPTVSDAPDDFGAIDVDAQQQQQKTNRSPFASMAGTDTTKFIPILRDNPHPGEIPPYLDTAPYGQVPYRQPSTSGGEVWEYCAYSLADGKLFDLTAHYNQHALQRGMTMTKRQPTSNARPGGVVASWSDGKNRLEVTAWPLPTEYAAPPLAPKNPLQWVVKYSYPQRPTAP